MANPPTPAIRIAVTMGDPGGIGPEVVLKAIADELADESVRYVVIGDVQLAAQTVRQGNLPLRLVPEAESTNQDRVVIRQPGRRSVPHATSGAPAHARAALAWLRDGARLCLRGEADALVTGPVNKESIIRSGERGFVGQTELLSELAGTRRTAMMLLGQDDRGRWLRVALATVHLPISQVARSLTKTKVRLAIELAAQACHELQLPRQRVAVCGLNPHAGEGGKIGREEITVIEPAIRAARLTGVEVVGPMAADTLFHQAVRGDCDAVVAMYHDQGLAPLKLVAFDTGVNWTLGLPFVRTSPDHGTAYDIVGQNVANPSSTRAAIRLARQLALRRLTIR